MRKNAARIPPIRRPRSPHLQAFRPPDLELFGPPTQPDARPVAHATRRASPSSPETRTPQPPTNNPPPPCPNPTKPPTTTSHSSRPCAAGGSCATSACTTGAAARSARGGAGWPAPLPQSANGSTSRMKALLFTAIQNLQPYNHSMKMAYTLLFMLSIFLASCGKRTGRAVDVDPTKDCPVCRGEGRVSGSCAPCNGTGQRTSGVFFKEVIVCSGCGGTGSASIVCHNCGGTGRKPSDQE